MAKLSLNKAAKEASVAKSTLLQALNSKRMSAEKNEKGHWEIETSELFRVFPRTGSAEHKEPNATPHAELLKTTKTVLWKSKLRCFVRRSRMPTLNESVKGNRQASRSRVCAGRSNARAPITGRHWRQSRTNARNIRQSRPDGFLGC